MSNLAYGIAAVGTGIVLAGCSSSKEAGSQGVFHPPQPELSADGLTGLFPTATPGVGPVTLNQAPPEAVSALNYLVIPAGGYPVELPVLHQDSEKLTTFRLGLANTGTSDMVFNQYVFSEAVNTANNSVNIKFIPQKDDESGVGIEFFGNGTAGFWVTVSSDNSIIPNEYTLNDEIYDLSLELAIRTAINAFGPLEQLYLNPFSEVDRTADIDAVFKKAKTTAALDAAGIFGMNYQEYLDFIFMNNILIHHQLGRGPEAYGLYISTLTNGPITRSLNQVASNP